MTESKNDTDTREPAVRDLVVERRVRASAEAIWKALSEAEGLRRWFPLDARMKPVEGGTIWLSTWGLADAALRPLRPALGQVASAVL